MMRKCRLIQIQSHVNTTLLWNQIITWIKWYWVFWENIDDSSSHLFQENTQCLLAGEVTKWSDFLPIGCWSHWIWLTLPCLSLVCPFCHYSELWSHLKSLEVSMPIHELASDLSMRCLCLVPSQRTDREQHSGSSRLQIAVSSHSSSPLLPPSQLRMVIRRLMWANLVLNTEPRSVM